METDSTLRPIMTKELEATIQQTIQNRSNDGSNKNERTEESVLEAVVERAEVKKLHFKLKLMHLMQDLD